MTKQYLVVVVDDDPLIRVVVRELLEDEGYHVLSCTSGTEARHVIARIRPDLVITDMRMESQDAGLQLLAHLRADPATHGLAVIVCSADDDQLAQQANKLALHGARVIVKPFDLEKLLQTIQEVLSPAPG